MIILLLAVGSSGMVYITGSYATALVLLVTALAVALLRFRPESVLALLAGSLAMLYAAGDFAYALVLLVAASVALVFHGCRRRTRFPQSEENANDRE